jgi:hypothetical protein
MKKSRIVCSGVVVAMVMSASAAFAANPASVSKAVPGSYFLQATKGDLFVNGNLQGQSATQYSGVAKLNIGVLNYGRNTNNYTATVKVRCAPNANPVSKTINGPEYFAQVSCSGTPNLWAASIKIN